jgi:predicted ribosomally synthesized peptide with nif11-like leader
MAKENVAKFYEALSSDAELQAKVKLVNDRYAGKDLSAEEKSKAFEEFILPIAKEAGYEFSMDELRKAEQQPGAGEEFSDEELAAVSGGLDMQTIGACFLIGAGIGGPCSEFAGSGFCLFVGWN